MKVCPYEEHLERRVSRFDSKVCKAVLAIHGSVAISCKSLDPDVLGDLVRFPGTSLSVTIHGEPFRESLVALARCLTALRERGVDTRLEFNTDWAPLLRDLALLLPLMSDNLEFSNLDMRGNAARWPDSIPSSYVVFSACQWDAVALDALEKVSIGVLGFNLIDQSPEIMSGVGRQCPDTRLEVTVADPTDTESIRILASEVRATMLSFPHLDDRPESLRALVDCEAAMELNSPESNAQQLAVIGDLKAEGLLFLDVSNLSAAFLDELVRGRTRWVKLEGTSRPLVITAAVAHRIVRWGERAYPGPHGSVSFNVDAGVRLTRRAKQILIGALVDDGLYEVNGSYARFTFVHRAGR